MPISRREMVGGIAALATTPTTANADTELVALGNQFDALTRVLDATDQWGDMADALDRIERAILNTQAKTMEGLRVKARAACWARLGDLDPAIGSSTDERMALSIIRDLIRCSIRTLSSPALYRRSLSSFNEESTMSKLFQSKRAMPGGQLLAQDPPPIP